MGEKGFILIHGEGKPPQKWRCMHLYRGKRLHLQAYDLHYIVQSGVKSGQTLGQNQA
jgi:hypothetical protein